VQGFDGPEKGKVLTRNVVGPIRESDIIMVKETEMSLSGLQGRYFCLRFDMKCFYGCWMHRNVGNEFPRFAMPAETRRRFDMKCFYGC